MSIAAVSKTRVAYISEVTWATTPATPTFLEMRRTNGGLQTKKTTVESEQINLYRRTPAVYQTGQDVAGSYDLEFSYATLDDMIAAALQSTWSSNVISDGATQQSFTFEETVDIGGGAFAYARYLGCEVNSLSLNFSSRAAVKGSVSLMGQQEVLDTAIISGATYTGVNTNQIETAAGIASLSLFSLSPIAKLKSFSLNIDNGMRVRDIVGSLYTQEPGSSQCKITGSMDVYFETNVAYALSLAHSSGAISFNVGTVTNKKYTISIPTAQITDGVKKLGGRNEDVMVTLPFEALGTSGSPALTITRNVA